MFMFIYELTYVIMGAKNWGNILYIQKKCNHNLNVQMTLYKYLTLINPVLS